MVSENTLPVVSVSPDTSFCPGNSVIIAATSAATNFEWTLGGVPQGNSNLLPVTQAGTYQVEVTDDFGCMTTEQVTVVEAMEPQVDLGPDLAFCTNSSVTLSAIPGQGTYQWFLDGDTIPGATSGSITIDGAGEYHVEVIVTED